MGAFLLFIHLSVIGIRPHEPIQGSSMTFKGVDYVHCSDGLPVAVGRVYYGIANYMLQENLHHPPTFFEHIPRHPLDAPSPGHPAECSLGDSMNGIF